MIREGIEHSEEEKDGEKLKLYTRMLKMNEIRELSNTSGEQEAIDQQIKGIWKDLQSIDDSRAADFEKEQIKKAEDDLDQRRSFGLKEIFLFYARQHSMLGRKATFEQIEHKNNVINIGEFMKFCKDFDISLSKTMMIALFKRNALNSIEMNIEQFESSLGKLFFEMNKEEIFKLNKRMKEVKKLYFTRKEQLATKTDK